jgi:Uma2 family endonuclease
MATAEATMTAEEFGRRPDPGYPEELVRGRIIAIPPPDRLHGFVCGLAYEIIRQYVKQHDLGAS